MSELNESWQRLPEARIRMREGDVDILAQALHKNGFCIVGSARVELLEDGIYIQIPTNTGKTHHNVIALPIDVFIPYKIEEKEESPDEQSSVQADP